jgi:hypothetical protein
MRLRDVDKEIQSAIDCMTASIEATAEDVRREVIQPLCDRRQLKFKQGMGTFVFVDAAGEVVLGAHTNAAEVPRAFRNAWRLLHTEADPQRRPLYLYMDDCDPREVAE